MDVLFQSDKLNFLLSLLYSDYTEIENYMLVKELIQAIVSLLSP